MSFSVVLNIGHPVGNTDVRLLPEFPHCIQTTLPNGKENQANFECSFKNTVRKTSVGLYITNIA